MFFAGYQPQRNASSLPALAVSARRDNGSRSGAAGAGAAGAAPLGGVEKMDHLLATNTSLGAGHHVHCLYKVQVHRRLRIIQFKTYSNTGGEHIFSQLPQIMKQIFYHLL